MSHVSVKDLCYEVSGRVGIVTGASSGLGVIFAETLAESGVNVVIAARRYDKLAEVEKKLEEKFGARVIPVQTDVTREKDVEKMVRTAVENFGEVDILVNNAGAATISPSIEMSLEEWNRVISVNLTGVFLCARAAAKEMMKKKYGKIINIASIYGAVGDVFPSAPYYATKGAVINLTRAFAIE